MSGSLPPRQLRNINIAEKDDNGGSLPPRQLRNGSRAMVSHLSSSLPPRQLRNDVLGMDEKKHVRCRPGSSEKCLR